jgi:hypothetical protein
MRKRILTLLFLVAGLSAYGLSLAQTSGKAPDYPPNRPVGVECREVALTRKPGWTLSGAFTLDGSQFRVVDALYNTILRYSSAGVSLGSVNEPLKSTLRDLLPVTGKSRGSDFIVEVSDGLMVLDKNLRLVTTKSVLATVGAQWSIGALWQWEPVGKKDIVAFTDVFRGTNRNDLSNWGTAFVRFPLDNPKALTILSLGPLTGSKDKGAFRSGYTYMASLGDTAYILSMGKQRVALYKNEAGSSRLDDLSDLLPPSLGNPSLLDWRTGQGYVDLMKGIEEQSMPVGLYGWNNSLYLLYRSPKDEGTRWELYNIDPARKNSTHSVELPIRANHVTVIPGPKTWAFIEKGPVRAYGAQDISRALFIPSELLEAPLRSSGMLCSR